MDKKVSIVINTLNEEKNITRAIDSVLWADEIIVCDMYSEDKTVEIAKKLGAKIVRHKKINYVEPARNSAIDKANSDWILILDADEEIPESLSKKLLQFVQKPLTSDFVEIPRKNIIFGKWMKASGWWPDYHVRFFKKGKVTWKDQIHGKPQTQGIGLTLPAKEQWAIVHHNYQNITQFIDRMNRYSQIQAEELRKGGYKFRWQDLLSKPLDEFLSRFFANRGYEDRLHGLALSLLQALSFLVVFLKVWEKNGFKEEELSMEQLIEEKEKSSRELNFWFNHSRGSGNILGRLFKIFRK